MPLFSFVSVNSRSITFSYLNLWLTLLSWWKFLPFLGVVVVLEIDRWKFIPITDPGLGERIRFLGLHHILHPVRRCVLYWRAILSKLWCFSCSLSVCLCVYVVPPPPHHFSCKLFSIWWGLCIRFSCTLLPNLCWLAYFKIIGSLGSWSFSFLVFCFLSLLASSWMFHS